MAENDTSINSSIVPNPPGRAINALDSFAISRFLVCISPTTVVRPYEGSSGDVSYSSNAFGIIPCTFPPNSTSRPATAPIIPLVPPPYTTVSVDTRTGYRERSYVCRRVQLVDVRIRRMRGQCLRRRHRRHRYYVVKKSPWVKMLMMKKLPSYCFVGSIDCREIPHLADIIPGRTNRGVAVGHLRSHIAVIGAHDQFIRPERLFMAMKRGRF